jgi:hypothetical protein
VKHVSGCQPFARVGRHQRLHRADIPRWLQVSGKHPDVVAAAVREVYRSPPLSLLQ